MADQAASLDELFDPAFLESIAHLLIVAGRVPRGGRFADQRSRDLGHGIEFRDFRPYAAGDDLRAIDWNIYRRLGRVFLRLFEELEDLPLYLLPDVSRSAFLEEPPRARAALQCSLALAAISLGQHDTVGVFPFSSDLDVRVRPQSGKNRVMSFARQLATIAPGGTTDFAQAAKRLGGMRLRKGLVVVVSDFFDPGGLPAVTEALGSLRHDLLLVLLVRPSDREVHLEGDLRLTDCETGAWQDVSVTPSVLERYRAAYDGFQAGLADFARRRHAGLLRLDVEQDVISQLATLFESGRYAV